MKKWRTILKWLLFINILLLIFFYFKDKIILFLNDENNDFTNKNDHLLNKNYYEISFGIKNNLPIKKNIKILKKIFINKKLLPISISKLFLLKKIKTKYFFLKEINLLQKIYENYFIELSPKSRIIAYINRLKVSTNDFLRLGINLEDGIKIKNCFHNKNIKTKEEIIKNLKTILHTTKQRFIPIIFQFIII